MSTLSLPTVDFPAQLAGTLLGTAVGDALGLPAENLSAGKIRKRWRGHWEMRFIFGRGMVSDDTEHTLMVALALVEEPADARRFQRALAWKFRWWFAALPGGVGLATARACIKLWLGFPPERSAVMSGGSGPAMRSAIIGAWFATDLEQRRAFVRVSSRLTHRGWQAETAALAVAECAAWVVNNGRPEGEAMLAMLGELSAEPAWQRVVSRIKISLPAGDSVAKFAAHLGLQNGVTGYALHVVPVAIFAWLRHPDDFRTALSAALDCGGDTDTVGAIVGALSGATLGTAGIPSEWRAGIWEWPRSIAYMERLAEQLAKQKSSGQRAGCVRCFWPAIPVRNFIFIGTVLVHGFRRLLPPY